MVRCVTTPGNSGSLSVHRSIGFWDEGGHDSGDETMIHHYDGPGEDRILLSRALD